MLLRFPDDPPPFFSFPPRARLYFFLSVILPPPEGQCPSWSSSKHNLQLETEGELQKKPENKNIFRMLKTSCSNKSMKKFPDALVKYIHYAKIQA